MLDFIEKLRQKPESYRRKFLIVFTTAVTGLIFLVWFTSFDFNTEVSDEDSIAVDNQLKPVDEIKSNIGNFFSAVKDVTVGAFYGSSTDSSDKVNQ